MITESMTIQGLHVISLALTPTERWQAAKHPFGTASTVEAQFTVFAVVALIISLILVFWVIAKHKRSEDRLKQNIARLTAANEKLWQKNAEFNREQIEVLEDIIDAEPPGKEIPGFNPQEIKALSELAKRLR